MADFAPYTERHLVITKNALRVYENKQKALSTYGKPIIAIPLSAVEKAERIKFDFNDDQRMEQAENKTLRLNKSLFEFQIKDEFLPIYTHQSYSKMFKDTSVACEFSPRKSINKKSVMSPARTSINSSKYSTS